MALAPVDDGGHPLAAERCFYDGVDIAHVEPVPSRFIAVDVDFKIALVANRVRDHVYRTEHARAEWEPSARENLARELTRLAA